MFNYEWVKDRLDTCVSMMRDEEDFEQRRLMAEVVDDLRLSLKLMTVEQAERSV